MPTLMRGRRPELDGIRTFAVLLVFGAHSIGDRLPGGFVGVDVFFVLSGVLITSLLAAEFQRKQTINRSAFYVRRVLRLYPALVVALVLAAALTPVIGYGWGRFAVDTVTALTYTFNFWALDQSPSIIGHFWSLSVEEQYYLLWPLVLLWLLRRGSAIKGCVVGIVATFAVQVALVPVLGGGRLYFLPFGHADELLIGSLLGLVLIDREVPRLRAALALPWLPWMAALPLLVVAVRASHIQAAWLYLGGLTALGFCSAAIIGAVLVRQDTVAARVLRLPPLVWLGQRSYSFYLFHLPVIALMRHEGLAYRYLVPFGILVTCTLSAVSWRLVEQPFLRLKDRRWHSAGEAIPAPAAPHVATTTAHPVSNT